MAWRVLLPGGDSITGTCACLVLLGDVETVQLNHGGFQSCHCPSRLIEQPWD